MTGDAIFDFPKPLEGKQYHLNVQGVKTSIVSEASECVSGNTGMLSEAFVNYKQFGMPEALESTPTTTKHQN